MKCNKGTDLVCYHYKDCEFAANCENVLIGIRENIRIEQERKKRIERMKRVKEIEDIKELLK